MRTIHRCRAVIQRVAGHLVTEKKRKIMEGEKNKSVFIERDLLSLLCTSNAGCSDGYALNDGF